MEAEEAKADPIIEHIVRQKEQTVTYFLFANDSNEIMQAKDHNKKDSNANKLHKSLKFLLKLQLPNLCRVKSLVSDPNDITQILHVILDLVDVKISSTLDV